MTMCGVGSLGTCRGLHDVKLARVRSLSSLVCYAVVRNNANYMMDTITS